MSEITTVLSALTTLFGAVITLCILVTGFWVGRRWMSMTGSDGGKDYEDSWDKEMDDFEDWAARNGTSTEDKRAWGEFQKSKH